MIVVWKPPNSQNDWSRFSVEKEGGDNTCPVTSDKSSLEFSAVWDTEV